MEEAATLLARVEGVDVAGNDLWIKLTARVFKGLDSKTNTTEKRIGSNWYLRWTAEVVSDIANIAADDSCIASSCHGPTFDDRRVGPRLLYCSASISKNSTTMRHMHLVRNKLIKLWPKKLYDHLLEQTSHKSYMVQKLRRYTQSGNQAGEKAGNATMYNHHHAPFGPVLSVTTSRSSMKFAGLFGQKLKHRMQRILRTSNAPLCSAVSSATAPLLWKQSLHRKSPWPFPRRRTQDVCGDMDTADMAQSWSAYEPQQTRSFLVVKHQCWEGTDWQNVLLAHQNVLLASVPLPVVSGSGLHLCSLVPWRSIRGRQLSRAGMILWNLRSYPSALTLCMKIIRSVYLFRAMNPSCCSPRGRAKLRARSMRLQRWFLMIPAQLSQTKEYEMFQRGNHSNPLKSQQMLSRHKQVHYVSCQVTRSPRWLKIYWLFWLQCIMRWPGFESVQGRSSFGFQVEATSTLDRLKPYS